MNEKELPEKLNSLTDMERKILRFIALNKTSKEIADKLFISYRTVQNHRYNIAQKLDLKGANKLLEFAIQNRELLVEPEDQSELVGVSEENIKDKRYISTRWLSISLFIILVLFIFWIINPFSTDPIQNEADNLVLGQTDKQRIAVMPFRLIGPDSSNDYLSDGLTEELITQISQIPDLRVIARSSVMSYKNKESSIEQIAADLQVGSVLEGSVQKESERLRINVQLIDTRSNENLWGQTFDREFSDILTIQREIAWQVAVALKVELFLEGLDGSTQDELVNEAAHTAYLKGRYFVNQNTGESFQKAIEFYREAIKIDSNYAKAWAGLADVYTWLSNYGFMAPGQAYAQSRRAAQKALQLAPDLGEAHTAVAAVALLYDWDFKLAEIEFQKALALNPSDVVARRLSALLQLALGNKDEAVKHSAIAVKLDPLSLVSNALYGRTYYFARQYEEAIKQYNNTVEIDPQFWLVHSYLGEAFLERGDYDKAISALKRAVELAPDNFAAVARLGYGYARREQKEKANEILKQLIDQSNNGRSLAFQIVLIHSALGNKDNAFKWMQKAFDNRHDFMLDLQTDPKLDPLRDDPRFDSFIEKMRF